MLRIGQGWDLHRLIEGRKLIIAGVDIPSDRGEDAHSDGDVLVHAVIDALLGAAAMDDIGTLFPPSDARWKDSDSRENLRHVVGLIKEAGYCVVNLDTTVVLESPKLGPHRQTIRENLAADLEIPVHEVSFKAKTHEKVDAVGEGRAVEAMAVLLLEKTEQTGKAGGSSSGGKKETPRLPFRDSQPMNTLGYLRKFFSRNR